VNSPGTAIVFSLRYGSGQAASGFVNRCDDVVVDSQDRIWVSGRGSSGGLPLVGNSLFTSASQGTFGFWGRFSANGAQLEYSSYLPQLATDNNNSGTDAVSLKVGPGDDIFVRSSSNNVSGSPGAFLRSPFQHPTFILRMNASGVLRYLTFLPIRNGLPASGWPEGTVNPVLLPRDMFVDSGGNVTISGGSYNGSSFGQLLDSVTNDALSSVGVDYLVTMNATGSDVVYATYLPSAPDERGRISAMAPDGLGAVYFVGAAYGQLLIPPTVVVAPTVSSTTVNGFFGKIDLARPSPSCSYSLFSNPGPALPIGGGGGSLTVLTGTNCPWQLDGNLVGGGFSAPVGTASQLRILSAPNLGSTISGSNGVLSALATGVGPGSISYQYASRVSEANPTAAASDNRTTFRLFGFYNTGIQPQTVVVTQPYQPCSSLLLSPAASSLGVGGGSGFTDLDLPPACSWSATSSAGWLTLGRTSGAGGGRLSFSVASNAGAVRSGTITITTSGPAPNITRTLIVNQAAGATLPTLALSSLSGTFPAAASTGSVSVLTQAGISWNAYTGDSWVTITSGATGTGPGTVSFSLLANPATTPRTALLTIGGQIFTVSQLGQACLFGLNPTSTVLPASGGTSSITVGVTGSTCPITATANASWIAIASTSATGVTFTVGANPGAAERTGTIRIADQTFSVTQAGSSCTYSLTKSTETFFATAGSGSTAVVTPGGCPWVAGASDPWVSVTSPANNVGPGTVTFTLAANPNATRRSASLFLGGQNFVVVQAGTNEGSCTANVASVPSIDADGVTELAGELLLSCSGLAAPVVSDLDLTVNTPITNVLPDAGLTINGIAPRLVGPNRLRWSGVPLAAGASVLRVNALRVNASYLGRPASFQANPIVASLAFSVPLTITNPAVSVAQATQAVAFSANGLTRPSGSTLAAGLVLFRETQPGAVRPGSRLRMVISNVPNGAELLLPVTPADGSARARLLSAAADGTGGTAVAGNRLNNTYALTPLTNGSAVATWEVLVADPLQTESFDFQILVNNALPADLPGLRFLGSPAPVSEVMVSSGTAPVVRYRDPASLGRRSELRVSTRILSGTAGSSAKVGGQRALFGPGVPIPIATTVTNTGSALQAQVQGSLPSFLLLRGCDAPCVAVNGQPTLPAAALGAGQSATLNFVAEVAPGVADGTPLTLLANALADDVAGDLTRASASTTILVGGVPLSLVLTPAGVNVPFTAGTTTVQLTTSVSTLSWSGSVTSGASWLTLGNPAGTGSAVLNLSFGANPTAVARQATVKVGNASVTITQAGAPPSVAGTGPVAGSALTQTFTFRFSHPSRFQDLGVLNVLINRALDGGRACYIAYSQPAGILFLVNDAGPDAGLSEPLVLGSAGSVSNSQCQVNGTGSSAVGSGNVLTLTLNITFRAAFAGNQVVYLAARDAAGTGNSGWSTMGFHQVPGAAVTFPNAIGMTPAAGSTASSTLTFTYEDQSNSTNIQTAWALVNTALNGAGACYVAYFAPGNILFLFPDDGSAAGLTNMVLAGTASLENSQCRVNAQGSSVVRSGGRLTLNLNMTFKPGFAGSKAVWLALQTLTNVTAPWKVAGAWQVPPWGRIRSRVYELAGPRQALLLESLADPFERHPIFEIEEFGIAGYQNGRLSTSQGDCESVGVGDAVTGFKPGGFKNRQFVGEHQTYRKGRETG
jgi:hypothetical protein